MKHLTIVVPAGQSNLSTVSCIAGVCKIVATANNCYSDAGKPPVFTVQVAGTSGTEEIPGGLFTINVNADILSVTKTALIIIPSIIPDYKHHLPGNETLINWLKNRYNEGAEIACMCSGAFLLAETGLLDGKSCSTHWAHTEGFITLFPKVNLLADQLITDENGIYTNGGAYSFLNLVIYLIEKYYDRPTAIYCSKTYQIEMDRNSQSPFSIFTGQKRHGDEIVRQAQTYIESRPGEKISVEELSSKFALGRRTFDRRFVKATGNTPLEYSQRVKIELAKKAFETTRKTINEVMYESGYSDIKAFREVFRKLTDMSPLEYRTKYNKDTKPKIRGRIENCDK